MIIVENQILLFLQLFDEIDSQFGTVMKLINIGSMIGLFLVLMVRIYLLYFQHEYNVAWRKNKWRSKISENDSNFFINEIKRWGSLKFLSIVGISAWLVIMTVIMLRFVFFCLTFVDCIFALMFLCFVLFCGWLVCCS